MGILIVLCAWAFRVPAQVRPAPDGVLNARIIGFSVPGAKGATGYTLEVARGRYATADLFEKNIVISETGNKPRFIAELPAFGVQYTWRISVSSSSAGQKGMLYYFSTGTAPEADTATRRLSVSMRDAALSDRYIFIDGTRALYDLDGNLVWFVPDLDSISPDAEVRDLKASRWGTITFLANEQAWEVRYDGTVVWNEPRVVFKRTMPMTDKLNYFHHHTFTRLAGERYITMGMERKQWDLPEVMKRPRHMPKARIVIDSAGNRKQQLLTNRIMILDNKHTLVWSWSYADYMVQSDVHNRTRPDGLFKTGGTSGNDFYFDESSKNIYASFRRMGRIVKIHYPDGKVLASYGSRYVPGNLEMVNDLFCGQHSPVRLRDSLLGLYNSNSCNRLCGGLPSIVLLHEPAKAGGQLQKVWEYQCAVDGMSGEELAGLRFDTGGSIQELPDRSLLCCMGGNYGKVFIVDRNKKVRWSALPEKWDPTTRTWLPRPGYRASLITRKELESLIWNEPVKK